VVSEPDRTRSERHHDAAAFRLRSDGSLVGRAALAQGTERPRGRRRGRDLRRRGLHCLYSTTGDYSFCGFPAAAETVPIDSDTLTNLIFCFFLSMRDQNHAFENFAASRGWPPVLGAHISCR